LGFLLTIKIWSFSSFILINIRLLFFYNICKLFLKLFYLERYFEVLMSEEIQKAIQVLENEYKTRKEAFDKWRGFLSLFVNYGSNFPFEYAS